MALPPTLSATDLPLPRYARGKVRDIYTLPGDRLLIVATDRLSAFDHVLPTPIPDKGRVLTRLSAFWFRRTAHIVPHHLLSTDLREPALDFPFAQALHGRAMIVRRAKRLDVECVVRGHLAGSAWEEYRRTGMVAGTGLPAGLSHGDELPEPIFTPATKAASGHDQNITFTALAALTGLDVAHRLRSRSIALYRFAQAHALACGLVLADTKFEFGVLEDGTLILIDEALTPDSSRYWDREAYERGRCDAFDKQFVRDHLTAMGWDREPPAPALPPEVVEATSARYREAHHRLTGETLP